MAKKVQNKIIQKAPGNSNPNMGITKFFKPQVNQKDIERITINSSPPLTYVEPSSYQETLNVESILSKPLVTLPNIDALVERISAQIITTQSQTQAQMIAPIQTYQLTPDQSKYIEPLQNYQSILTPIISKKPEDLSVEKMVIDSRKQNRLIQSSSENSESLISVIPRQQNSLISVNSLNPNVQTFLNPNHHQNDFEIKINKKAFTTEEQESMINILENQTEQNRIANQMTRTFQCDQSRDSLIHHYLHLLETTPNHWKIYNNLLAFCCVIASNILKKNKLLPTITFNIQRNGFMALLLGEDVFQCGKCKALSQKRFRKERHTDCEFYKDKKPYDAVKCNNKFLCLVCFQVYDLLKELMEHYVELHHPADLAYLGVHPMLIKTHEAARADQPPKSVPLIRVSLPGEAIQLKMTKAFKHFQANILRIAEPMEALMKPFVQPFPFAVRDDDAFFHLNVFGKTVFFIYKKALLFTSVIGRLGIAYFLKQARSVAQILNAPYLQIQNCIDNGSHYALQSSLIVSGAQELRYLDDDIERFRSCVNNKQFYQDIANKYNSIMAVGLFILDSHDLSAWYLDETTGVVQLLKPHLIVSSYRTWLELGPFKIKHMNHRKVHLTKDVGMYFGLACMIVRGFQIDQYGMKPHYIEMDVKCRLPSYRFEYEIGLIFAASTDIRDRLVGVLKKILHNQTFSLQGMMQVIDELFKIKEIIDQDVQQNALRLERENNRQQRRQGEMIRNESSTSD